MFHRLALEHLQSAALSPVISLGLSFETVSGEGMSGLTSGPMISRHVPSLYIEPMIISRRNPSQALLDQQHHGL